jgi:cytochrome c
MMMKRSSLILALPLLLGLAPSAWAAGDPVAGKAVFQRCAACHSTARGGTSLGPSLAGVVGRKAGAQPGFAYSPALARLAQTWTPARLDAFLLHPQAVAPGTRMGFAGLADATQRGDVIAYLGTLK